MISSPRSDNAKLGMFLFILYAIFYTVFVLINAFAADSMEAIVFSGLNLAVVYGFSLILIAFLFAIIYGVLCKKEVDQ